MQRAPQGHHSTATKEWSRFGRAAPAGKGRTNQLSAPPQDHHRFAKSARPGRPNVGNLKTSVPARLGVLETGQRDLWVGNYSFSSINEDKKKLEGKSSYIAHGTHREISTSHRGMLFKIVGALGDSKKKRGKDLSIDRNAPWVNNIRLEGSGGKVRRENSKTPLHSIRLFI